MGNSIVYAIKIALAVTATMGIVVASIALFGLLTSLVSSSVLGEVFGLISVYLPFNPATVFGSISATIIGIIAFLIARKIWELTATTYNMS